MSELFEIPETLSPRLKWIADHGILLDQNYLDRTEDKRWPWMACVPYRNQGFGNTQDEALTDLAKNLKISLWNGA